MDLELSCVRAAMPVFFSFVSSAIDFYIEHACALVVGLLLFLLNFVNDHVI